MNLEDDAILIEALIKGESSAFKYMYSHHFGGVRNTVIKYGGSVDSVKDHFQDCLIQLMKNLSTGKFEGNSKLSTYFLSIAKFSWWDKNRKLAKEYEFKDEMKKQAIQPDEINDNSKFDLHALLTRELENIQADCSEVLRSYYFLKLPLKEIALNMGYTNEFVRVKKGRCLKSMRDKLDKDLLNKI